MISEKRRIEEMDGYIQSQIRRMVFGIRNKGEESIDGIEELLSIYGEEALLCYLQSLFEAIYETVGVESINAIYRKCLEKQLTGKDSALNLIDEGFLVNRALSEFFTSSGKYSESMVSTKGRSEPPSSSTIKPFLEFFIEKLDIFAEVKLSVLLSLTNSEIPSICESSLTLISTLIETSQVDLNSLGATVRGNLLYLLHEFCWESTIYTKDENLARTLRVSYLNALNDIQHHVFSQHDEYNKVFAYKASPPTIPSGIPGYIPYKKAATLEYIRKEMKSKILETKEVDFLSELLNEALDVAAYIKDIGPECTRSVQTFEEQVLNRFSSLDESDFSRILFVMMQLRGESDLAKPLAWNLQVLSEVIVKKRLNWIKILEGLDNPEFPMEGRRSYQVVLDVQKMVEPGIGFPLRIVLTRWRNRRIQFEFLRQLLRSPVEELSFSHLTEFQPPIEGVNNTPPPDVKSLRGSEQTWLSLPLMRSIIELSEHLDGTKVIKELMDVPYHHYPELLLAGLSRIYSQNPNKAYPQVFFELMTQLVVMFISNQQKGKVVLPIVWKLTPGIFMEAVVKIYEKDRSALTRILDISKDLKVTEYWLDTPYHYFAVDLAALAARREYLNLNLWLQRKIQSKKSSFVDACFAYIEDQFAVLKHGDPVKSKLASGTAGYFIQALQKLSHMLAPPFLQKLGELSQRWRTSQSEVNVIKPPAMAGEMFPEATKKAANDIFVSMYTGEHPVERVVEMVAKLAGSNNEKEREILECLVQNLFHEYSHFHEFPEHELRITGKFLGLLIHYNVVQQFQLAVALRIVLESLKKQQDQKLFMFGMAALEQFAARLHEWPQYISQILMIKDIRELNPELFKAVNQQLIQMRNIMGSPLSPTMSGERSPPTFKSIGSAQFAIAMSTSSASNSPPNRPITQVEPPEPPILHLYQRPPQLAEPGQVEAENQGQAEESASQVSAAGAQPAGGTMQEGTEGSTKKPTFTTSLSIETLVAGETAEQPTDEATDLVHFIFNNVSQNNIEEKKKELIEGLDPIFVDFLCEYIVVRRASLEPNFHALYIKFLLTLEDTFKNIVGRVTHFTVKSVKALLASEKVISTIGERSLLKNLGQWLGILTLARDKPILMKDIVLKRELLIAYEGGRLIATIPFVRKVLVACAQSKVFKSENPWLSKLLKLMKELYSCRLKMMLAFEIDGLFNDLGISPGDIKASTLLRGRSFKIDGNPDFESQYLEQISSQMLQRKMQAALSNQSQMHIHQPYSMGGQTPPLPVQGQQPPKVAQAPPQIPTQQLQPKLSQPGIPAQQIPQKGIPVRPLEPSAHAVEVGKDDSQDISEATLRKAAFEATLSTIRDIFHPVVERSVTIACFTTRELMLKDYAMCPDEQAMREAAHSMVDALARSLAVVSCKEPLRVNLINHLKQIFSNKLAARKPTKEYIEKLAHFYAAENIEKACVVIEKKVSEKALKDIDNVLKLAYEIRQTTRETTGDPYYDLTIFDIGHFPSQGLPEPLKPVPGMLKSQIEVYKDFNFSRIRKMSKMHRTKHPLPAAQATPMQQAQANVQANAPMQEQRREAELVIVSEAKKKDRGKEEGLEQDRANEVEVKEVINPVLSPSPNISPLTSSTDINELIRSVFNPKTGLSSADEKRNVDESVSQKETLTASEKAWQVRLTEELKRESSNEKLSVSEVMERFEGTISGLGGAVSEYGEDQSLSELKSEIKKIFYAKIGEVGKHLRQAISVEETAIALAQKSFNLLFERANHALFADVMTNVLKKIRDVYAKVVKNITTFLLYSEDSRKLRLDIVVRLFRSRLLATNQYDKAMAKAMDSGRNVAVVSFCVSLIKTILLDERLVAFSDFYEILAVIQKIARNNDDVQMLEVYTEASKAVSSRKNKSKSTQKERRDERDRDKDEEKKDFPANPRAIVGGSGDPSQPIAMPEQSGNIRERAYNFLASCAALFSRDTSHHCDRLVSRAGQEKDTGEFLTACVSVAVEVHRYGTPKFDVKPEETDRDAPIGRTVLDILAKFLVFFTVHASRKVAESGCEEERTHILGFVMNSLKRSLVEDAKEGSTNFNQKAYYALLLAFIHEMKELCGEKVMEKEKDDGREGNPTVSSSSATSVTLLPADVAFGMAKFFLTVGPTKIPRFVFAWLQLISHKDYMPALLRTAPEKEQGWKEFSLLLADMLKFLHPLLAMKSTELTEPSRMLYKGTLLVLLVILHDFPEFLCKYYFIFCDRIPPTCVQMRNLILCAFPRSIKLPDPFAPKLRIESLPEIKETPTLAINFGDKLSSELMEQLSGFISTASGSGSGKIPSTVATAIMEPLWHSSSEENCKVYDVRYINALVLFVITRQLEANATTGGLFSISGTPALDIFFYLSTKLDEEGRYYLYSALANHLRYPNRHTYVSCLLLLTLFSHIHGEAVKEQITRVIIERLIVTRPHPWGLLVTFIELMKATSSSFWSYEFTHCAPEIEKLFHAVSRSFTGYKMGQQGQGQSQGQSQSQI